LQTKLYVPRLRPSLVPRPRLIEQLNHGLQHDCKLTFISAPAGFGKTTLISEWIAAGKRPFAWLSLDERDSDFPRFLAYFIAALQTLRPTLGARASRLLESTEPPPSEAVLTTLLNEIAAVPEEFTLVLDDYHVVDAHPVDEALAFLLEHLPPQMHLVMTTREDPPLPLSRLRARGLLTELRAADLRFTAEETAVFLNQITGLNLAAEEIAALERRTEGWVAGLQLAALSMQGRADIHGFVAAFAGDDRYIVDYLVDEVLLRQPEHIRRFLHHTSILTRLSGPLCDAVVGAPATGVLAFDPEWQTAVTLQSQETLEFLERANLFVVPLDDKRNWYRYHHLFAGVLQAHLLKEQPEIIPSLHQRASLWYQQNNLTADAVHHALAAEDFARAAAIIELAWAKMDRNRQSAAWLRWAKRLPDELIHVRPVLSVGLAWAYLDTGELETAESWLQQAENTLETETHFNVADEKEYQMLPGTMAAARTYLALALGDMPGTVKYAQQALAHFPEDEYLRRGTPAALLGLAFWAGGDLPEAQSAFAEAMSSYQKAGNILFVITGAYVLADMALAQGHLREALKIYEDALQLAQTHGDAVMRGAADLYTGLSELHLERNDLAAAKESLRQSMEFGEEAALPRWHYRWCLAQARIQEAEGNLDDALDSLDEAERQYVRGPVPDIRSPAAMKARISLRQGRLDEAWRWAAGEGLSANDDLNYLREFDHITLVRLLLAHQRRDPSGHDVEEASSLLARLLQAAEAGQRMGNVIEILLLQAQAYEVQGSLSQAASSLERALVLAEPEGYVRLFVAEGQPLAALLQRLKAEGSGPKAYVSRLLTAFGVQEAERSTAVHASPLVEPLSERELEVLQLVAAGLSNREIAGRLYLALPTVKGHNRNIYSKLQVNRRTEAVARARELGLL
ncbi:MAG: hypothetical protein KC441_00780, partial [Anaerolineales bacterium]|nr:hypothetical protein [Anaerolineales bacterium]